MDTQQPYTNTAKICHEAVRTKRGVLAGVIDLPWTMLSQDRKARLVEDVVFFIKKPEAGPDGPHNTRLIALLLDRKRAGQGLPHSGGEYFLTTMFHKLPQEIQEDYVLTHSIVRALHPPKVPARKPGHMSIASEVVEEVNRATDMFPRPQFSAHEAYAVLKEEVDELWDEVKGKHPERQTRMREEAIQVSAMAIRFVHEVCDLTDEQTSQMLLAFLQDSSEESDDKDDDTSPAE